MLLRHILSGSVSLRNLMKLVCGGEQIKSSLTELSTMTKKDDFDRSYRERQHGRMLSLGHPESIWGWGTPAGELRARRRGKLIATSAELGPGKHALEVGCGTGMFTEMFANSGAEIIAVDISRDLLRRARGRGLVNVKFLEKRFEDCDLDGPFDAVIGSSTLHHLDLEAALRTIHRLLKPGGVMCFAEPNMLNPQVFRERKFRRFHWYVSPDETAFLRVKLRVILKKAGFTDVTTRPFDWLHPATPVPLIGAVSRLGGFLERTPFVREFAASILIRCRRPS
jgi:2-polyprenyl-3-methyl-5-hydroxy-6-metoxy-1,4-benzoquinol methylase